MTLTIVLLLAALLVVPALAADRGKLAGGPRIAELEYYEDLEDGRRHNVATRIKGEADRVSARIGKVRSDGRESGRISGGGKGKTWFFRDRKFVNGVRAALVTQGAATIAVRAKGDGVVKRKRCTLVFEPDPQFGDYAGGKCRKP